MSTELLIYIPTYQRLEKLKNCLASIQIAIDGYEDLVKIVISNNGSTDGTKEYLDSLFHEWLTVAHKPENEGAHSNILAAFNLNLCAQYLWIIGDDDYLMPTAISGLLDIINNFPAADYIFCNTKAFSPDQYAEKINELITTHNVSGGNIKSKQILGTGLVKFHQIINPAVADTLLGELMVNCYKLSSIKEFDYLYYKSLNLKNWKIDWGEVDLTTVGLTAQPHNLPMIDCYSSDSTAVYCDQVRTFNFWGTAEWIDNYDLIFPLVILFLIKEYTKKGIIDRKSSLALMKYYLSAMGPSLQRQAHGISKAIPFSANLKAELFDAIINYLYAPKI